MQFNYFMKYCIAENGLFGYLRYLVYYKVFISQLLKAIFGHVIAHNAKNCTGYTLLQTTTTKI